MGLFSSFTKFVSKTAGKKVTNVVIKTAATKSVQTASGVLVKESAEVLTRESVEVLSRQILKAGNGKLAADLQKALIKRITDDAVRQVGKEAGEGLVKSTLKKAAAKGIKLSPKVLFATVAVGIVAVSQGALGDTLEEVVDGAIVDLATKSGNAVSDITQTILESIGLGNLGQYLKWGFIGFLIVFVITVIYKVYSLIPSRGYNNDRRYIEPYYGR